MKLDEVIPYIQKIDNLDIAKTILEIKSDPNGYYYKIYEIVCDALEKHISERELLKLFSEYEEHMALKHFQYIFSVHDENVKKHKPFHKKIFLEAILDVTDIYSLRLYLTKLNKKLKGEDITYKKYVPEYRSLV